MQDWGFGKGGRSEPGKNAGVLLASAVLAGGWAGRSRAVAAATTGVETFNRKFDETILKMDNAAAVALWAGDGESLLPGMAPIEGKPAIAKFLDEIVTQMPGYKVTAQHTEYHGMEVAGDWASEWGRTQQTVQPPDGRPPIVAEGKILLVLHREKDGDWKIEREMWNAAPKQ